ncbi:tRNA pseudouridine(55) synthase TruB, partial [Buchnera aphidicola (Hormaphis cornu)]
TYQIPPLYSAIKYKGQSLYKYVRSGITNIPLIPRKIIIYQIKYINRFKNFIELYIWCSKGTYVRSLINDIGQQLHCGAHVVFLRRLQIGSFSKNNLFTLHKLYELKKNLDTNDESCYKTIDALLLPLHTSEISLPLIYISMEQSLCFSKGQKILLSHVNNINICVRVIAERKNKFLGIGFINKYKYLIPRRVSSVLFS